eukprot:Skav215310  [mRNA]  locus=scaffold2444:50678:52045:+ [translate_table: standard]
MQSLNLFLGLSVSLPGQRFLEGLHQLQLKLERRFYVPPRPTVANLTKICPVSGARWQGEWLLETDFLKDFQAELDVVPTPPTSYTETKSTAERQREAWVCTLFAGPELSWRQVALHAEVIRTLAFSIRRSSKQQRPFVVLTEATIPADLRDELLADGLRLEYFHGPSLVMKVPAGYEWKLSWFQGRKLVPTMGQLAVWNLSYDTVVMLDDDMLMVDSSDELFTIPVFAMSHDPLPLWSAPDPKKRDSKQTRLNNAARVVHPNKRFFRHLVKQLQSGDFKDHDLINFWGYDLQSLEDAFWGKYGPRRGITSFSEGAFSGCSKASPGIGSMLNFRTDQWAEEKQETVNVSDPAHCVLPADYNFFVDFKSIFSMVYFGITSEDLKTTSVRSLMKRLATFLYRSSSLIGRPKILHWPGSMRKPWERIHPRVRSGWDDLWWEAHQAMCQASPAVCRISCD